jgi:hypothetical protein
MAKSIQDSPRRHRSFIIMLLFDDSQKLEKTLGAEAAAVLAHVFERADENWQRELATKADLQEGLLRLEMQMDKRIAETKHDILRWMFGGFITQTALLMAVLAVVLTVLK